MWTNIINGKTYRGSSLDFFSRFFKYFNYNALKKNNMLISLAILKYKLLNFSLDILEYCYKNDVLERKQYYLDSYQPIYNILKYAGSSLGYIHTESSLSKLKSRLVSKSTLEKWEREYKLKKQKLKLVKL